VTRAELEDYIRIIGTEPLHDRVTYLKNKESLVQNIFLVFLRKVAQASGEWH
jgi:hypothetical protein